MTTTTLRPNGTVSATVDMIGNPAVVTGAASVNAALSDNSDASYADCIAYRLDFTTVALPTGAVTKSVVQRIRLTGSNAYTVYLNTPSSGIYCIDTFASPTGTITTHTGAAHAISAVQAEIDAFRMDFGCNTSSDRIYEAYIDLTYALVPTCTVSAPTGTITATNAPTCTWAYTAGSDGDVQSRYQVRVFTAAQYGIGGFDPAVSPNTFDSGVQTGAASSYALPPLANGVTFKAYVLVSQTINGTPQPGAWTAGPAFTISVTTSDITSVVGTADNVNGRISILVTRNGATPTWTSLEVQRSADAGATWAAIRGTNGTTGVAVSGATWTLYDYEAANAASVLYQARATYLVSGLPVTGAFVSSASCSWTMPVDWLKDCRLTARNRQVNIRVNPTLDRPRTQGIHEVIGRSDPVGISDVRQLRAGTLEVVTFGDTAAVDFLSLTSTDVLLLQTRPGNRFGAAYILIAGPQEVPVVPEVGFESNRFWSVAFREVAKPIDVGIV